MSAGFSPDGSRIVASDLGGTTSMVDADTGKVLFVLPYHGVVVKAAFDPSGRYIATGGVDGTLRIWDERDGSQVGSLLHSSTSLIVDLTFAGEDRVIAMGSDGVAVAASVPDARQLFVLRAG